MKKFTFLLAAFAVAVSAFAQEVVVKELDTTGSLKGSNSAYANACDVTSDGIVWNFTGNSQQNPWRLGGNSLSAVDKEVYTKTAISDDITKIEVVHGTATSITVNSFSLLVASSADFSDATTYAGTFAANATATFERPDGADWANKYFKFIYNVTVSGTTTRFVQFSGVKFYAVVAVAKPVLSPEDGKVTDGNFTEAFTLTLSCATDGAKIFYTLDDTDPASSATAVEYTATPITIPAKSTKVRAVAVNDDNEYSAEATATYCYINSEATAYTTSEAIEVIDAGLGLSNELYVKGTITEVTSYNATYGSLTYTITDGTKELLVFGGLNFDKGKFESEEGLLVGDDVVVCGKLTLYNTTYELNSNNYLVSRIVNSSVIECANADLGSKVFSLNEDEPQEIVVKGYNLTSAITYTLENDAPFTVTGDLTTEGGTLTITFIGTEDGEYESTLTLASGDVTKSVTISCVASSLTGEGTKENPYTVDDVQAIGTLLGSSDKYWVIGYILGSYKGSTPVWADADAAVNTNIVLGGAKADSTTVVPVQLPSGSVRTAINVADHPTYVGRQVKVYGTLETYFSMPGVKNPSDYELLPDTTTSVQNATLPAQETIKVVENGQLIIIRDNVRYNAQGVKLN